MFGKEGKLAKKGIYTKKNSIEKIIVQKYTYYEFSCRNSVNQSILYDTIKSAKRAAKRMQSEAK